MVVEDAAQGMGVTFGDKHVGTFRDVGCLSFYADKTITTGEGGALMTNSEELAERCLYFKNQGRLQRGSFVHPKLGYNFRVTDLQAAVGVAQMKKLPFIIGRKIENESLYKSSLKDVEEVAFPEPTKVGQRVPFRVIVLVADPGDLGGFLTAKEIGIRRVFYPLHRQPCFNGKNCVSVGPYKNSDEIFRRGLSLPSGAGLTEKQIKYVCEMIKQYFAGRESKGRKESREVAGKLRIRR
jgi:perosamine synthetase